MTSDLDRICLTNDAADMLAAALDQLSPAYILRCKTLGDAFRRFWARGSSVDCATLISLVQPNGHGPGRLLPQVYRSRAIRQGRCRINAPSQVLPVSPRGAILLTPSLHEAPSRPSASENGKSNTSRGSAKASLQSNAPRAAAKEVSLRSNAARAAVKEVSLQSNSGFQCGPPSGTASATATQSTIRSTPAASSPTSDLECQTTAKYFQTKYPSLTPIRINDLVRAAQGFIEAEVLLLEKYKSIWSPRDGIFDDRTEHCTRFQRLQRGRSKVQGNNTLNSCADRIGLVYLWYEVEEAMNAVRGRGKQKKSVAIANLAKDSGTTESALSNDYNNSKSYKYLLSKHGPGNLLVLGLKVEKVWQKMTEEDIDRVIDYRDTQHPDLKKMASSLDLVASSVMVEGLIAYGWTHSALEDTNHPLTHQYRPAASQPHAQKRNHTASTSRKRKGQHDLNHERHKRRPGTVVSTSSSAVGCLETSALQGSEAPPYHPISSEAGDDPGESNGSTREKTNVAGMAPEATGSYTATLPTQERSSQIQAQPNTSSLSQYCDPNASIHQPATLLDAGLQGDQDCIGNGTSGAVQLATDPQENSHCEPVLYCCMSQLQNGYSYTPSLFG